MFPMLRIIILVHVDFAMDLPEYPGTQVRINEERRIQSELQQADRDLPERCFHQA